MLPLKSGQGWKAMFLWPVVIHVSGLKFVTAYLSNIPASEAQPCSFPQHLDTRSTWPHQRHFFVAVAGIVRDPYSRLDYALVRLFTIHRIESGFGEGKA